MAPASALGKLSAPDAFAAFDRLYKAGRTIEAERIFQAALQTYPRHPYSLLLRGVMAQRAGKGDAVELLMQAANANDQEADFHNNLGNALAAAGRADAALPQYEKALALDPDSVEVLFNLANTLAALQRFDAATAAYEKVIALRPDYAEAHYNFGNILYQSGRTGEAMTRFETAVALQPNSAEARNNLGVVLNDLKRYDEAAAQFKKALAIAPHYPDAHSNIGMVLAAQDRDAEAIPHFEKAIALQSDFVVAINNLGNALFRLDRYGEARVQFERALSLAPGSADIANGLGATLYRLGLWTEAMALLERAVALRPRFADAWLNMAKACNDQRLDERALICCDNVLAIEPDNVDAHNNRGIALAALNRFDEAIESYQRALAIQPNLAEVRFNIGSALIYRGRSGEGMDFLDQAIALEPRRPKYRLSHVLTRRVTAGDPRLGELEALARDTAGMSDEARTDLHFALAKAYGDTGHHDRSFAELLAGNALKRKSVAYDEAATLRNLSHFAAAWPRHVVDDWRGRGNPSDRPIFILGMPRSGSTLVEQILASHPAVAAGGEVWMFQSAATGAFGPLEDFDPARIPAEHRGALLGRIAERYLSALGSLAPGAQRITDKMPSNFAFAGLIHLAFPNARIVHTRRNALDIGLSCFSTLFASGVPFSYDLGEIGRYYRAYDRLMRHWRAVLPPSAILDLDYEMLVSDFEAQARRLIDYCGLPWDDACLAFHKTQRPVRTASASQVRQPLYGTSVDRWRAVDPALLAPLRAALEGPAA
jgi:tetratricopeptide (TPR) repeat protein